MSERALSVAGQALLIRSLKEKHAIARAIKARDVVALAGAAMIAKRDLSAADAMTDPARYRALRQAITQFHLNGYGAMNVEALKKRAAVALEAASQKK
jgi:hypothetical protein